MKLKHSSLLLLPEKTPFTSPFSVLNLAFWSWHNDLKSHKSIKSTFRIGLIALVMMAALAFPNPLSAATLTWTNTAGGDWASATNWSPQQVPGESDVAVINDTAAYTIVLAGYRFVSELVMDNPNATLRIVGDGSSSLNSLSVANGFENRGVIEMSSEGGAAGATLQVTSGVLTNAMGGSIRVPEGSGGSRAISANLDNRGAFEVGWEVQLSQWASGGHRNSGEVNIAPGAQLIVSSGDWLQTSEGEMSIAEGAVFDFPGTGAQRHWTYQGGTVTGSGTITTSSSAMYLNLEADFSTDGIGIEAFRLTVNGPGRFIVPAGPVLFLNAWTINTDFEYDRDLLVYGARVNGGFSVPEGRTVRIGDTNFGGGAIDLEVAYGFENRGTIELGGDVGTKGAGIVVTSGILTNTVGGVIRVLEGNQPFSPITAELENRGKIELNRDAVLQKGPGIQQRNSGLISVVAGKLSVYNFYGGNSLLNEGEIRVHADGVFEPSAGALTNTASGLFSGTGEFRLEGVPTILNEGIVAPGVSPGLLSISGSYPWSAAAVLDLELRGFTPGTEHDQLALADAGVLDGVIRVSLIDDFFPRKDDAFTVLTYPSRTSSFTTLDNPLPERIAWEVQYGATSAQLVVLNTAPTLATITNQTVNEETQFSVTANATDQDLPAQTMTYLLDTAPPGMTINPASGQIIWTPTEAQGPGIYDVTVRVTDNGAPALGHSNAFTVTVNEVNVAPQIALPPATVAEQSELVVTITATDADLPANALTYEMLSAPPSASFNPATREFRWTPTEAQGPGDFTATFRVTDHNPASVNEQQLSATGSLSISVNEVNIAPQLVLPGEQTVAEQSELVVTINGTDADLPANALTYELVSAPPGATFNPAMREFRWTPTEAQGPGSYDVTVSVTDNGTPALGHTNSFTVTVNEINVAPQLALPAQTVAEQSELLVTINGTDADLPANALTYELVSAPLGATFNPATREFRWTPTEAQGPGVFDVTMRVTDNGAPALSHTNAFTVTVNEMNVAPQIALPAQTVAEQSELVVTIDGADADLPVNALTYELLSGPTGAIFNPATREFRWTPTEAQGPGNFTASFRITDDNSGAVNERQLSATNSLSIAVDEVNLPPSLVPPANRTIHAGIVLSTTATATDPDVPANTFTYAKVSGPAGVSVSAAGLVTWSTGAADVATTNVIVLQVTDNGTPNLSATNSFVVTVDAPVQFTSIRKGASVATAEWDSIPGTSYRLTYKTNLADATWSDLGDIVTAGGNTASIEDSSADATRFYRLVVLP